MRLDIFEENNSQKWNDIINSSANGTLYHSWEWLKIVEKHSSSKLFPLVFFDADDEKPFAAIPLFYMKKLGVKMVFSPPPGSAITLGPVFTDKGYKQHKFELAYLDFQMSIDSLIKKLGSDYTSILTSPGLLDIRPFQWAGYSVTPYYTYKIDLTQDEDMLWNNLSRYLKRDIKRAEARGIQVIEGNYNKDVDYIYNSLKECYRVQHLRLPLRRDYLHDILAKFGDSSAKILAAMHDEKLIGVIVFISHRDTTTAWVGGVRFESNELASNEFLLWRSITQTKKDGYKWFENMGANTSHLCNSKARFCPELSIYFSIKKANWLGSLAEKAYMMKKKGGFSLKQ